jgi:GDP-L-fucose synthase
MIPRSARVLVTGQRGLVGSALLRRLEHEGFTAILTAPRSELDLRDQGAVDAWFSANRPDFVFHAAGTVGGIAANSARPAEFIYDNLMMASTVIHSSYRHDVSKLLYLGSSCIYPRLATQPITENQLLAGHLEPTNEWYAVAKIAGIKLCEAYRRQHGCNFISAMPTNLYGPNDNFDPESSHVLPGLIRRFHEAKIKGAAEVVVWGTGEPLREFLYVDDLANACVFLMDKYDDADHINVGSGFEVSIAELAGLVREVVYPEARVEFDTARPNGTPRKALDVSRMSGLGWRATTELAEGIARTYKWFLEHESPAALASVLG